MYRWLNEHSQLFLERGYLLEGQTVDDRVKVIANRAEQVLGIEGYGDKFTEYFKKGWFSLSSPIWSNFGTERGLPISCFGQTLDDTMESILSNVAETGMMSKYGGGTSASFGHIRPRGSDVKDNGTSFGSVHFMQLYESTVNIVSQGSTRRGSFAPYLPIDHKDIDEFLTIRKEGSPIQDLYPGVVVSDEWMEDMIAGNHEYRKTWAKVLESRVSSGFPYIMFSGNVNKNTVDVYKDKEMEITHSNLCSEIMLADSVDESFVCDLSSMNVLYYDEWKDTDAVETLTFLLDAVMTEFIEKAESLPYMSKAVEFARNQRAIGIGWLGWHSYLQSKMIAFESMEAKYENSAVAQCIQDQAYEASTKLAEMFGEPELLKGYGRRNTTLTAIAPTKSSAFILGQVSEGIEPHRSNYYIKDLAKGKFSIKNKELEKLLESKGKNVGEVWNSILRNSGSVQHLDFLSDHEKDVFKTMIEISPKELITQAAQRQNWVDQSQSLNLLIDPRVPIKEINALMIEAWKMGVKSLYYHISVNAAQQLTRSITSCESCEG